MLVLCRQQARSWNKPGHRAAQQFVCPLVVPAFSSGFTLSAASMRVCVVWMRDADEWKCWNIPMMVVADCSGRLLRVAG